MIFISKFTSMCLVALPVKNIHVAECSVYNICMHAISTRDSIYWCLSGY